MPRRREERFNSKLADALSRRGADAEAEVITVQGGSTRLPDIQVSWYGVAIVLECKFDGNSAVRAAVEEQARERLAQSFGSVAIALLYPPELRTAPDIDAALENADFRVKLFSPGHESPTWTEVSGLDALAGMLESARALLADDRVVQHSVDRLRGAVDSFSRAAKNQPGRIPDLLAVVTVADAAGAGKGDSRAQAAAVRICGLAVTTAAILQVELSSVDPKVPPLPGLDPPATLRKRLIRSWKKILDHNYAAIFDVGVEVLDKLSDTDPALSQALVTIENTAKAVASEQVLGRHDLIGRVYHTLLADARYLATYYTSVPAASLLCHLVLDPSLWPDVDWTAEPEDFSMRIGDLACGTGTLLAAAMTTLRQRWAARRAAVGKEADVDALGEKLIESNIYGMDVLAYAVQICAATLLLSTGGTIVKRTRLYQMPFGGTQGRLGSLELLMGPTQAALFGDPGRREVTLREVVKEAADEDLPPLDVVIMNPPFTRSVHSNQLLGSLQGLEFTRARRRLSDLVGRPDVAANLNAGIAAPFIELAHRRVREGGRLALVLPKSVLTGESWTPTRELLGQHWHLEYVITSQESRRWNFSDSTSLSEVLLIARKWRSDEDRADAKTTWVSLWRNPVNSVEALGVASLLRRLGTPSEGGAAFRIGDKGVGEFFARAAPTDGRPWRHATFARAALDAVAEAILEAQPVPLPRAVAPVAIPLEPLTEMAEIGPDVRDVRDGFTLGSLAEGYPGWWNHDADSVLTLSQVPNQQLHPRTEAAPGRPKKSAAQLWTGSGRLMIAARLRLVTMRCTAVVLNEPALGSMWWPARLKSDDVADEHILALWLNSTLGIVSLLQSSEETEGPWIQMKKNKLLQLPVLAPASLDSGARKSLLKTWKATAHKPLGPISKLGDDPVRHEIDTAICEALGLPEEPVYGLRQMLDSEPRLGG